MKTNTAENTAAYKTAILEMLERIKDPAYLQKVYTLLKEHERKAEG